MQSDDMLKIHIDLRRQLCGRPIHDSWVGSMRSLDFLRVNSGPEMRSRFLVRENISKIDRKPTYYYHKTRVVYGLSRLCIPESRILTLFQGLILPKNSRDRIKPRIVEDSYRNFQFGS